METCLIINICLKRTRKPRVLNTRPLFCKNQDLTGTTPAVNKAGAPRKRLSEEEMVVPSDITIRPKKERKCSEIEYDEA